MKLIKTVLSLKNKTFNPTEIKKGSIFPKSFSKQKNHSSTIHFVTKIKHFNIKQHLVMVYYFIYVASSRITGDTFWVLVYFTLTAHDL